MKQLHSNLKSGEIKISIENLDDLWYLSTIIDPGDSVKGKTLRKIKIGDEGDRKQKITKKPVFLQIKAEKIEFSKTSDILRVSGIIEQAPDDISLGTHHTFNLDINSTITIIKTQWLKFQLDKIKEACKEKPSKILIVNHDREEALFATIKKYGFELLSKIEGNVEKKADNVAGDNKFYPEIIKKIEDYDKRYEFNNIIIASPAFWKEELTKKLNNQTLKSKIILATCSSVGKNGIHEIMKRPETIQALKQERASEEIAAVEQLLSEISKDNLAVYGLKQTEDAGVAGAVEKLLITDTMIIRSRDKNKYQQIENILKSVETSKGKVIIISSDHDGGKKLDGLGGIGGILRYKLSY